MITETDVEWTWYIRRVKVRNSNGELTNIIHSITWSLEGEYIDPSNKEHYVRDYSTITELPEVIDSSSFIEYDSLEKDNLISWIVANEGDEVISAHKQKIIKRLNEELGNSEEGEFSDLTTRVINFD